MAYTKQNFEDGQVLKAEHLNKIETELAREKSWNELKDKPFEVIVGEVVLLELTQLVDADESSCPNSVEWDLKYSYPEFDFRKISAGDRVLINVDGNVYDLTAVDLYGDGMTILVGNPLAVTGEDNGIPFSLRSYSGLTGWFCEFVMHYTSIVTGHTLGVSYIAETVKKIETKYLKNSVTLYPAYMGDEYWYGLCETESDALSCSNLITRPRLRELVDEYATIRIYYLCSDGGGSFELATVIENLYVDHDYSNDAAYIATGVYDISSGHSKRYYTAEHFG